jgi:hypothetical protein
MSFVVSHATNRRRGIRFLVPFYGASYLALFGPFLSFFLSVFVLFLLFRCFFGASRLAPLGPSLDGSCVSHHIGLPA